jgi:hypothetical protein
MTAKEYFSKYGELIIKEWDTKSGENAQGFLLELSSEAEELCKIRRSNTNATFLAILKELNQKWNAVCALFEKKYGESPLIRNGFLEVWKHQVPGIEALLKASSSRSLGRG